MSKWKNTSKHWSKTSKREEVLDKVIKNLRQDYWVGKNRSDETKEKIRKTKKGVSIWGGKRDGMFWLFGNKNGFKKGQMSWNKGLKGFCSGEKNNMWKGGVTPLNEKIRKSMEMKNWREAVFKRDNWTCQKCARKGGNLNADHVMPFAFFPELRFEVLNGQTLCAGCHRKTITWGDSRAIIKSFPELQIINKLNLII